MAATFSTDSLTMIRGDTFTFDAQLFRADGRVFDITGAKVYFTMKLSAVQPDADSLCQLYSPSNGVTIIDALAGRITVKVPPIATRALQDGNVKCPADIQVIEANGDITTVDMMTITVIPDITRALT